MAIWQQEQIFCARSDLGDARLYTIAIGSTHLFLATKMAQFGRDLHPISDNNEIQEQMSKPFSTLRVPGSLM
jgi:hypothetical protein